MARMVPEVALEDIAHDSERLVYEALGALPDPYVVIHSFPWLRPVRDLAGQPLREGEADFVVLHPSRGMLVLEVKGGNPELRNLTWYRGGKPMRDPFAQAQRSRYALLEALEERTGRQMTRTMFPHGDAVVFPHCLYQGDLPHNADSRIILDASGLAEMHSRIEAAFAAWTRQPVSLTVAQFRAMIEALLPSLRLLRCVGAELASERARIVQVTEDQRATLLGLLANERVLVEGTAGSGKTLLALEYVTTLAARGHRALLLCYNRHLAAWLNELVKSDPRASSARGAVEVTTFHSFALSLARRAGVQFEVPATGAEDFWESEAPLVLEHALAVLTARGTPVVFDAVVVDEAQDFAPDWWVTVESLTRGGRTGKLYAFLDLNQSLRREPAVPPVPLPVRFHLSTNCRNTRVIARTGGRLAGVDVALLPGSPEGEAPLVRRAPTAAASAGIVLEEIRKLLQSGVSAQQVAVIGPAALERSSLARCSSVGGVPFTADAAAWRKGDGVLVTTARAFKGLEADIVVLYDLGTFGGTFNRTDLYVAWTRARHRLLVGCHGPEVRGLVEEVVAQCAREALPSASGPVQAPTG
jgi:hypothetical protein